VTGYPVIGLEVDDDTRGRTFAFLQSGIRVILFAVIAIAPVLAGAFNALISSGGAANLRIGGFYYGNVGYNLVLLLAAVVALLLGRVAYKQMDDRKGVPLKADLAAVFRGEAQHPVQAANASANAGGGSRRPGHPGLFLAFEGGEGAGKSTQARLLAIWLREQGYDVIATHEPGATKIGMRLRALLLDTAHTGLAPRAETLMYAADRAEHVQSLILPALERGAVVVTDRYIDSSLAYQGAGRQLPVAEIQQVNEWGTGGLMPDLTILLDLAPSTGLGRRHSSADRLESEPLDFHQRVRSGFLALAAAHPSRYLIIDASRPEGEISREIQNRIRDMLPDPVPFAAEENTGSFPAVRD
jgi:dTMP kinase